MKNRVILIGAINEGNIPTCGETMKNQLFIKRFRELFDSVITVDTLNWQHRPWVLIKMFFSLLFNRGAKVVISASSSASYLISFLYYIPLKKNIYFWVVGGNLQNSVAQGRYNIKALKALKGILVQGQCMVEALNKFGLSNILHVPNSKPIIFTPQSIEQKGTVCKFLFLSRVHPDKGVSDIISATQQLNAIGYDKQFCVDFYGKVEPSFVAEFESMIEATPNAEYKGVLNLKDSAGYEQLSKYDMMLFPTYWDGEGFPGVVLDANMAGVPIISSDWSMNSEVVQEGYTGFIIPTRDTKALAESMKSVIEGRVDLEQMKRNCLDWVQQYDVKNVITIELLSKIGLISR